MSMTNKLSLAKRRSGLTSAALSRRSGVPLSTVNKILSGQTVHPSPQSLERLCQALDISMGYLLDDTIPDEYYLSAQCEGSSLHYLSQQEWELVRDYGVLTVQGRQMVDALLEMLLALSPLPLPTGRRRLLLCIQPIAQGQRGALMDGFDFSILDASSDCVTGGADFAVLLTDGSMAPVYAPGTMLAVKRGTVAVNQLGLFLHNRELFPRKLSRSSGRTKLVAINVSYKDILVRPEDELSCMGAILGAVRDYTRIPKAGAPSRGNAIADFLYSQRIKL